MNDKIAAKEVQLISSEGENLGVYPTAKALEAAKAMNLDLVVLAEKEVPLAKIMDFGKTLYEKKKKLSEGKKKQKVVKVKEVKMRPKIGIHDYQTKINRGIKFLNDGNKLKVTLMFRGREAHTKEERGAAMFERVDKSFQEAELKNIANEKDLKSGPFWSRIYYLKSNK